MSTILITGATGTIGKQVAQSLLSKGANVRVGLRDPAKGAELAEAGATVVPFDFEKPETFAPAFEGVERVFLLSPFVENFVELVEQAARAATDAGVKFIARLSALGADPNSPEGLSGQHGRAEEAIKASGADWAVLRPTFFQDNVLNYQAPTLAQGSFYGASHAGKTSYVSSRDVAEVAAAILLTPQSHAGKTYTLTGPKALSDEELAGLLSRVSGRSIAYVDLPDAQLLQGQVDAGSPRWRAEHLVALEGVKAAGWAASTSPDVQAVLGRAPEGYADFLGRNQARI